MTRAFTVLAVVVMLPLATEAIPIKLGTASGGLMVYYNNIDVSGENGVPDERISGYDENPDNQAYSLAHFGYDNAKGMGFQFDDTDLGGGTSWNDIFSGQPVGSSQFGFDLFGLAATYNPAGGVTIPDIDFVDNVDNTVAGALHTDVVPESSFAAWAINDYKEPSGPGSGGSVINSVLRGTSFTLNVTNLSVQGTVYTMDIAGELYGDGLFHWYDPAEPGSNGDGTTSMSAWLLTDTLTFSGTLHYDMDYAAQGWDYGWNTYTNGLDNGADQVDFYAGDIDVYVEYIPEPATMTLLAMGGLAVLRSKRGRGRRSAIPPWRVSFRQSGT